MGKERDRRAGVKSREAIQDIGGEQGKRKGYLIMLNGAVRTGEADQNKNFKDEVLVMREFAEMAAGKARGRRVGFSSGHIRGKSYPR